MIARSWLYPLRYALGVFGVCSLASLVAFTVRQVGVEASAYFTLSLSFSILLASSFIGAVSEFFLILNVFLFLGFWGKTTVYLITNQNFSDLTYLVSDETMNTAMMASAYFAIGLLFVEALARFISHRDFFSSLQNRWPKIQFSKTQTLLICAVLIGLCAINSWIGFLRVGLPSASHIPFPLSILMSWMMGPGSPFVFYFGILALNPWLLVMAFLSAIALAFSTLSRNAMMYFLYPLFVRFILVNRFSKKTVWIGLGSILFILFVVVGVSQLRWHYYFSRPQADTLQAQPPLLQVRDLLLNRWVGIEGVITAVRQPADQTFWNLVLERPDAENGRLYVKLSQPDQFRNDKNLYVSNLPGPAGIIFFAESVGLRVLAFLVYASLVVLSFLTVQILARGLSRSVVTWWSAQGLSQISIFFLFNAKVYLVYLCIPVLFLFVVSYWQRRRT